MRFLLHDWGGGKVEVGGRTAQLVEAFASERSLCIVLEPLQLGSALDVIRLGAAGPMPEPILSVVLRCVLLAVRSVHRAGFACATAPVSGEKEGARGWRSRCVCSLR